MKGYRDDGGVLHYTALELPRGRYDYALCEHEERKDGADGYMHRIPGRLTVVTCSEREISCLLCLAIAPETSTVQSREPHGR